MSHVLFVHVAQVLKDGPDSRELVLLQDGMATMEMAGRTVRTETRGMLKAGGGSMRQVKGTSDETLVIWGCRTLSQLVDNLFIFMKGTILINLHFPLFQCCGRTDFSHATIFMCLVATRWFFHLQICQERKDVKRSQSQSEVQLGQLVYFGRDRLMVITHAHLTVPKNMTS